MGSVRRSHRGIPTRHRVPAAVAALALAAAACGGDSGGAAAEGGEDAGSDTASEPAAASEDGELTDLTMQLGWIASNNQLGEIVADAKGYYAEEGIELTIEPGGPNVDGIALVASGQADIGQVSSSPSLMLAVSEGIPVRAFATAAAEHPYTYYSMPDVPLDSVEDFAGLDIGAQATGEVLLDAALAANDMSRDDIGGFTPIGAEITPLLTEQVDVWTGWETNTAQIDEIPEGYHSLRLWDAGVQLYANPYYAHEDLVEGEPELLEGFMRATARGWQYADENFDEAVDLLLEAYPNLDREAEADGSQVILDYVLGDTAREKGWGTMDPEVWQGQIDLWDELGQFAAEVPALEDVATFDLLERTADDRQLD